MISATTEELGIAEGLASKIPDGAAQLRVMDAEDLDSIRTGGSPADSRVAPARDRARLYGLALYLAGERRRETLRMVGFFHRRRRARAIAQRLAGDAVVGALTTTAAAATPAEEAWEGDLADRQRQRGDRLRHRHRLRRLARRPTRAASAVRRWITPISGSRASPTRDSPFCSCSSLVGSARPRTGCRPRCC